MTGAIIGVDVANLVASQIGATRRYNISGVATVSAAGGYLTTFTQISNGNPAKDFVIDKVYVTATRAPATFLTRRPRPWRCLSRLCGA